MAGANIFVEVVGCVAAVVVGCVVAVVVVVVDVVADVGCCFIISISPNVISAYSSDMPLDLRFNTIFAWSKFSIIFLKSVVPIILAAEKFGPNILFQLPG